MIQRSPDELRNIRLLAQRELCRCSFPDFLAYCRIEGPDGPERMQPWTWQHDAAEDWQRGQSEVVLKRRQVGGSWLLAAYMLWRAQWSHWAIGYWSKGEEEARWQLSRRVRYLWQHLPAHLQLEARWTADMAEWADGGHIRVFPSTENAGIGYTFDLAIQDEAAAHPYGEINYANLAPTLGSRGGQYIALSTANPELGPNGFFYDIWNRSEAGETGYATRFVGLDARPDQDEAWYERERRRYTGIPQAFDAMYPASPAMAFVGREGLVYPMFDPERHVRESSPIAWAEAWSRRFATDYGGGHPTAVVVALTYRRVGEGFSRIHVTDIYYRTDGAPSVDEMYSFLAPYQVAAPFSQGEGDPAPGGEVINESFRALGLPCRRGVAKREGIGVVQQYLENGWLTFDAARCGPIFREIRSYRWREQTDPHSKERYATNTPVEHHGDALDALRLLVVGLFRDEVQSMGGIVVWDEVRL